MRLVSIDWLTQGPYTFQEFPVIVLGIIVLGGIIAVRISVPKKPLVLSLTRNNLSNFSVGFFWTVLQAYPIPETLNVHLSDTVAQGENISFKDVGKPRNGTLCASSLASVRMSQISSQSWRKTGQIPKIVSDSFFSHFFPQESTSLSALNSISEFCHKFLDQSTWENCSKRIFFSKWEICSISKLIESQKKSLNAINIQRAHTPGGGQAMNIQRAYTPGGGQAMFVNAFVCTVLVVTSPTVDWLVDWR